MNFSSVFLTSSLRLSLLIYFAVSLYIVQVLETVCRVELLQFSTSFLYDNSFTFISLVRISILSLIQLFCNLFFWLLNFLKLFFSFFQNIALKRRNKRIKSILNFVKSVYKFLIGKQRSCEINLL